MLLRPITHLSFSTPETVFDKTKDLTVNVKAITIIGCVLPRIKIPDIEQLDPDIKALVAQSPGTHFLIEANSPNLFKGLRQVRTIIAKDSNIRRRLLEYIDIAVSTYNGCHYCTEVHSELISRMGVKPESLKDFLSDFKSGGLNEMEREVVAFALKICKDPHEVTDQDIARLRRHGLTDRDLLHVVHEVNLMSASNRVMIVFAPEARHNDDLKVESKAWKAVA